MAGKSDFSKVLGMVDKMTSGAGGFAKDETYWKPEQDKAGNAFSTIRFLPERENSTPFVRIMSHAFKNAAGKWLIENCPTTIEKDCPICSLNSEIWAEGTEAAKKIVRERKRKTQYIANVLIVQDPKHPENDGKVMKFKFGKKIFEKIIDAIKPTFEDTEPINPFCPFTGADFKLKMRKVDGYSSYDKSEFAAPSEIGSEKEVAKILTQLHDLDAEVAPDKFLSGEALQRKLDMVLKGVRPAAAPVEDDEEFEDNPPEPKAAKEPKKPARPLPAKVDLSAEEDDDLAYFQSLSTM